MAEQPETTMLADWQRDQAAECPCRGTDEVCPCQNAIGADWLFRRLRIETALDDDHARVVAKVLADSGQGMEVVRGRSAADIQALATVLRRIKLEDDLARVAREEEERQAIFGALCAVLLKP